MRLNPRLVGVLAVIVFLIALRPCEAYSKRSHKSKRHRRQYRRRSQSSSCQKAQSGLKSAYYAQVDLIRRGLPKRVVQSEFTWAVNQLAKKDESFRSSRLSSVCVQTKTWHKVFNRKYQADFALRYLGKIKSWKPDINFLSFTSYPKLPPMTRAERDLVDGLWEEALDALRRTKRDRFKIRDFPFPSNVEVLHDPGREKACKEYRKFGPLDADDSVNARTFLVSLTVISVKLYRMGGSSTSITQMLKHFVAYTFDGVRCFRQEEENLRIPGLLQQAYSRNIAFIYSSIRYRREEPHISKKAVEEVFKDELKSLLSYNSWGQLSYAVLSETSSIPRIVNSIGTILGRSRYYKLLSYSQGHKPGKPWYSRQLDLPISTERAPVRCSFGYVYMERAADVQNQLENCCSVVCRSWARLLSSYVRFPSESCCARSNEYNQSPSGVQEVDKYDNMWTSFIVPRYGSQGLLSLFLVLI